MHPNLVALIFATAVAVAVGFAGGFNEVGRVFHGYPVTDKYFLEALGIFGFYFAITFWLVIKFPKWPTKTLMFFCTNFRMSTLREPEQRISFLMLCAGAAVGAVTVTLYYINGHENFFRLLTGESWASYWYRTWFFASLSFAVTGLLGSFCYKSTLKPLIAWVKGTKEPPPPQ